MSQSNPEFHNLDRLIGALGEYAPEDDYELTDIEIADILWLTCKREEFGHRRDNALNSTKQEHNQDTEITKTKDKSDLPLHNLPTLDTNPSTPPDYSPPKAPVYSSSDSSSFDRDLSLGIPDAPSLREPLNLLKYLRLLMQKVPSGRETEIDEDATVNQIAETKIWTPILQDELEPWLDLALVIDESSSMLIWGHTITELQEFLQNYGIFRELKIWGIKLDDSKTKVQLISRNGSNRRIANPKELVDLTRRRLILIVSDCVSNIWRKGFIFPILNLWANKQPVAIIQMLPDLMWRKSALNLGMLVNLSSSRSGVANKDLISSKVSPSPDATKIPIVSLEPECVFSWTEMLVGKREVSVPGYLLPHQLNIEDHSLLQKQQKALENPDTEARLARFRRTTSPLGRKLGSLLAASPVIRLPIVRLIQKTLLPDSGQIQIAEVFLGGLLKPKTAFISEVDSNPELVEYEFIDPVIRDIFLEDAPVSDSVEILNAVSRYIAEQMGISMKKFMAYLKSPNIKSKERNDLQPFAEVAINILKKLGDDHLRLAEEIEESRFGKRSNQTKVLLSDRAENKPSYNLQPLETTFKQQKKSSNIKVLIIEANPEGYLSLDREIRELRQKIDLANNSQDASVIFQVQDGTTDGGIVRKKHLQEILLKFEQLEPKDSSIIVHFCGHGTGEQGLVFETENGDRNFVDTETLTGFFELFKEQVDCVIMNACYSSVQAEAIVEHIDYAVGMKQTIRDDSAIAFSTGFYLALAYSKNYEDAFKFGCNAIQLKTVTPSIDSQQISKETRNLIPSGLVPEITITEEYKKPELHFSKVSPASNYRKNQARRAPNNLQNRDYKKFIGREQEKKELLENLSFKFNQHISIIHGIEGIGKTALAMEVAYHTLFNSLEDMDGNIEEFEAIIFTSAKQEYLTPIGIKIQATQQRNLQEIFQTIAEVLNQSNIIRASKNEQKKLVYKVLSQQKTLLIIDNLETISEQDEKEEILGFLANLPNTTKVIITTRLKEGFHKQIGLSELSRAESLALIQQEAEKKGIEITSEEAEKFYEFFGGIPVALIYAVGQRYMGHSMEMILGELDPSEPKLSDHLSEFIFENSIAPLRNKPAHYLLMAMTLFYNPPTREALSYVADFTRQPIKQEEVLLDLQRLSLLKEEKYRYQILPITRRFVLDEIAKYPDFKEQAQNRLIEFYQQFTRRYGGKDWQDWVINYNYLAEEWENIQFVLSLCASLDRYQEMFEIWESIDHFVDLSSKWSIRLYWWTLIAERANQIADLTTYTKALSEKAWTLILIKSSDNQAQAEQLLNRAWKYREYVDLDTQAHIANHFAVYHKTEHRYEEALSWLETQEDLVSRSSLSKREKYRHQVCIHYYRAEIFYLQNNSAQAKELFERVIELGTQIKWQRFTNYAQNYLVDILIAEGDLSQKVERLLYLGLYWAEKNKEKRRIAHWQGSYARYEYARGNLAQARQWAEKALAIFRYEYMENNIKKMEALLQSL